MRSLRACRLDCVDRKVYVSPCRGTTIPNREHVRVGSADLPKERSGAIHKGRLDCSTHGSRDNGRPFVVIATRRMTTRMPPTDHADETIS
jgi:hypothetical protein